MVMLWSAWESWASNVLRYLPSAGLRREIVSVYHRYPSDRWHWIGTTRTWMCWRSAPFRSRADGFLFVENERSEWTMPIPLPLKHARLISLRARWTIALADSLHDHGQMEICFQFRNWKFVISLHNLSMAHFLRIHRTT